MHVCFIMMCLSIDNVLKLEQRNREQPQQKKIQMCASFLSRLQCFKRGKWKHSSKYLYITTWLCYIRCFQFALHNNSPFLTRFAEARPRIRSTSIRNHQWRQLNSTNVAVQLDKSVSDRVYLFHFIFHVKFLYYYTLSFQLLRHCSRNILCWNLICWNNHGNL